jgi:F0F1-type ATP synthase assembly protein I
MGFELAGGIIGFVLVGYWIDYSFGTAPKGAIGGAVLGCIGGFYNFIRQAIAAGREQERVRRALGTADKPREHDEHPPQPSE